MNLQPRHDGAKLFWTCPINVNGLDRQCVKTLVENDLSDLLRPTLATAAAPSAEFQVHREVGPLSYGNLHDVVEHRMAGLTHFLRQVWLSVDACRVIGQCSAPLRFRALSGDSHDGGKRPLLIEMPSGSWVLKFADPRPHQLLADLLGEASHGLGTDLRPPAVVAAPDCQSYFMPYLEPDEGGGHDVNAFMFAVGALTAVAYSLRMVDLHLENLLVFKGKPVIIDPECIFYSFPSDGDQDRLLSTGLLSHNPGLSALRGGDPANQTIIQIGLCERSDGILDYGRPVTSFHNRFRNADGSVADPAHHRSTFLGGFTAAFEWLLGNADLISDILDHHVVDDFRIRYLVRKTRLYIATIHMLNLPVSCGYDVWRKSVFARFRTAGHFPKAVAERLVEAELDDMDARDVPFFWISAGEAVIQHRTGPKQRLPHRWTAREHAIRDIRSLSRDDMNRQVDVLAHFLDADLHAPIDVAKVGHRSHDQNAAALRR